MSRFIKARHIRNITKATIDKLFPGIDKSVIEQVIDKIENLEEMS